jgi:FixJ family two-component response regulator
MEGIRKTELIGIVDDDEGVRDAITSLVRSAGFRAAAFASAETLLDSEESDTLACLILDVRMPGLNGLELQSRLAEEKRGVPIIFASAYTDPLIQAKALERGAVAFLHKPFGERELFWAMRLALG